MKYWIVLLSLLLASPASAVPSRQITFDPGGQLDKYYTAMVKARMAGQKIIIDGVCLSACTMITGLFPRDQVCVTPRAILGFHSAFDEKGGFASEGTRLFWQILSADVKDLLRAKGWNGDTEHPDFIYLTYSEIKSLFRECSPADMAELAPKEVKNDNAPEGLQRD
jgi:hypothetical protein